MKKRLISLLLCITTLLSVCALTLTSCSSGATKEEGTPTTTTTDEAATLVLWCVTEEGTDDEQAQDVAKQMAEITKSQFKADLIVKYFTLDEYYTKLEEAFEWQEAEAARKKQEAADKKNDKNDKNDKEEEPAEEPEEEDEYDEDGNLIIDKTKYPELTEEEMLYQVDILYLSGYDKYTEYIAEKYLADLKAELNGDAKKISNYVSTALLNAVKSGDKTYAIPNNNVIGEYTYMLINKELFDKYYYTASVDDVHSIVDLADFLEDVSKYETDVQPINGDVNYCMSLIAHYWDIDPNNNYQVGNNFSVLGYAYRPEDSINRGQVALKFDNLLLDEVYKNALLNLMDFNFAGYFGEAAEGQTSAVSFVKGDSTEAEKYEDDNYVIVVDYPRAQAEDIYGNMFAVSAYSSNVNKSMQIITLLNTDVEFRNLFLYGIENVNYTQDADGFVQTTTGNKYHMDIAKTGNEFLAYLPEGTDPDIWDNAKQQNREALVAPLLGFDAMEMLTDDSEMLDEDMLVWADREDEYVVETFDKDTILAVYNLSKEIWDEIMACASTDELEELWPTLELKVNTNAVVSCMEYEYVQPKYDCAQPDHIAKDPETGTPVVLDTTVSVTIREELRNGVVFSKGEPVYDLEKPILDANGVQMYAQARDEDGKLMVDENGDPVYIQQEDENGDLVFDEDGNPVYELAYEYQTEAEVYHVYYIKVNYYQMYYRWMTTYGYLPAGFGAE